MKKQQKQQKNVTCIKIMCKNSQEKLSKYAERYSGITLISLVITIIILIILAGVSISLILGENGLFTKAQKAAKDMDIASLKEQIGTELLSMQIENEENNFVIEKSEVEKVLSKYGQVIKSEDGNIIGLKPTGKDYEIPFSELWEGETTNSYNATKHVNVPKLAEGMIPIKYSEGQWEICSENDSEWYNYDESHKEWANVMLSDGTYKAETAEIGKKVEDTELGSMFVWIPRYAYSINEYGVEKDGEGETQKITDVTFLVGTTNKDEDGNEYALDYNTDEVEKAKAETEGKTVSTPKIVHPAFNFGGTNLSGIWVAKFEASMEGQENKNTTGTTGDDITTKNVKVLPNVQSWRYIRVGNAFTNCIKMNDSENIYGITSAVDSHLMKNSEWGAVTYLSASQYGITPTINTSNENNSGKYKAYTGGQDYKSKLTQSTTGNITGIYDMCGGACEYVAAYYDNQNDNLGTNGTTIYFEGNKLKAEYEKYWDKYEVNEEEKAKDTSWEDDNDKIKQLAKKRLNLMKDVKGIGIYDVKNTFSFYGKVNGSWKWIPDVQGITTQYGVGIYNKDYTLVGNISQPFLLRGGGWNNGTGAGVFFSYGYGGNALGDRRLPPGVSCTLSKKERFK